MTKRMLIDAAHAEETRVVVVDGNRIEELDFESQSRKQLRGNIYLAKVTRVEPSLPDCSGYRPAPARPHHASMIRRLASRTGRGVDRKPRMIHPRVSAGSTTASISSSDAMLIAFPRA